LNAVRSSRLRLGRTKDYSVQHRTFIAEHSVWFICLKNYLLKKLKFPKVQLFFFQKHEEYFACFEKKGNILFPAALVSPVVNQSS
jgi:hypothetical protein